MFFIFNKDKAVSYFITVFTVAILFLTASLFGNSKETVPTSVNENGLLQTNNENIADNNMIDNNK